MKNKVPRNEYRPIKKLTTKILNRIPAFRNLLDPETARLKKLPRFTKTETIFFDKKIQIPDAASFLFIKGELFNQEIYKFNTENATPYIIDCGANIGLSIKYFKKRFPNAVILGFEPDENIFSFLEYNVKAFGFEDVEILKKACWNKETSFKFFSEGADAERVAKSFDKTSVIHVSTISLRNYMNRKIDFLKMDIEGAEDIVLNDIKDLLINVERIFIEFHSFVDQEQTVPDILKILKDAGFPFIIHHIGTYSPNPFISVSNYLNMFAA